MIKYHGQRQHLDERVYSGSQKKSLGHMQGVECFQIIVLTPHIPSGQIAGALQWWERRILSLPILLGKILRSAIATGRVLLETQQVQHIYLSNQIEDNLSLAQEGVVILWNQIDPWASMLLHNHRGLDLLRPGKVNICVFLGEECCFYANQSGHLREKC